MLFDKRNAFQTAIAIHSSGVVRSVSWKEHGILVLAATDDLTLDLCGRPTSLRLREEGGVRRLSSSQDVRILGALVLSDRPVAPDDLPTEVADPSKVVERLRRRLAARWVSTQGRGESKFYAFAIPSGKSVLVLVPATLSLDLNCIPWFGAGGVGVLG